MTKTEVNTFIEKMEKMGDYGWTEETVEDSMFMDISLDEAIRKRSKEVAFMAGIIQQATENVPLN